MATDKSKKVMRQILLSTLKEFEIDGVKSDKIDTCVVHDAIVSAIDAAYKKGYAQAKSESYPDFSELSKSE